MPDVKPEVKAIKAISKALDELTDEERYRVLMFIVDLYPTNMPLADSPA